MLVSVRILLRQLKEILRLNDPPCVRFRRQVSFLWFYDFSVKGRAPHNWYIADIVIVKDVLGLNADYLHNIIEVGQAVLVLEEDVDVLLIEQVNLGFQASHFG